MGKHQANYKNFYEEAILRDDKYLFNANGMLTYDKYRHRYETVIKN